MVLEDRRHAGQLLAETLSKKYKGKDLVIIALPRGGVPVAAEIAKELNAPLEILAVRKVGAPLNPEFAVGAVSEDGEVILNKNAITQLSLNEETISKIARQEMMEIQRQVQQFRKGHPPIGVSGKSVILVDDGLATGATAWAAARFLKKKGARSICLAVPVAAHETAERMRTKVDDVVALAEPLDFLAVGHWYEDFSPVTDEEVIEALGENRREMTEGQIEKAVYLSVGDKEIAGDLSVPNDPKALIIFAHGSGSSRKSPRNRFVAQRLNKAGFATLLCDLLTPTEETNRANVFDIDLLAERVLGSVRWARRNRDLKALPIGLFGASTGSAATLKGAANSKPEDRIYSIVSRGGRPDLAGPALDNVKIPVLLLVGSLDRTVLDLNRQARKKLSNSELVIVPDAGHLFEEPGALEQVAEEACEWFTSNLTQTRNAENNPLKTRKLKSVDSLEEAVLSHMIPLKKEADLDGLISQIKDKRVVMLGEATHGTAEFYALRRQISQILIKDYGFKFIAVEGDWPDAYRLNQYIRFDEGSSAAQVLKHNHRWPTWMWANDEIVKLAEWMKMWITRRLIRARLP